MECVSMLKMNRNPLQRGSRFWKEIPEQGVLIWKEPVHHPIIHPSILSPSLPSFFKSGKEEVEELTYADPMLHWGPLQLPGEPSYGPYLAGFSWSPATEMNSG